MPWSNQTTGATLGAGAGMMMGGPAGAAIGAGLGGAVGGMFDSGAKMPDVPILPAQRYPGAVSTPYGSMVYDPITGGTKFIQNTTSGFSPSSYQDAALYDALQNGGNGAGASQGLTNQIQTAQLMLDQLKAQGGGKQPTYADFGIPTDPKTGQPINYQNYINTRGTANPLWDQFMRDTGGNYGSSNPDISFGKWAKDWTEKSLNPQIQAYQNATKAWGSNNEAAQNAIQQQELQLAQMKVMAGSQGAAQSGLSQNPLLMALQQQEQEANSPYYLKAMNAQTQNTYDNQLQAQDQALAARGMGGSGLGEMTRARMGLQLGNSFNQNALAANQMTTDKRQQALTNRMNMLNFLAGRKDTGFNQQMQQQGLGLQQMNLGSQVGQNQLNSAAQMDIAQAGLQSQYGLAGWNQQNANAMQQQNNWASALGGLGYGAATQGWFSPKPVTYSGTHYGGDAGSTQPIGGFDRSSNNIDWNPKVP